MQPHYDLILHVLHDITLHMFLKTVRSILNCIQGLLSAIVTFNSITLNQNETNDKTKTKHGDIFIPIPIGR